jgi:hypothetical protein
VREALGHGDARDGQVVQAQRRGHAQQAADGGAELRGLVDGARVVVVTRAQRRRQRRRAEAMAVLVGQAVGQVLGRAAVAARLEHARQQLLGRLAGLEVEQLVLLARQHEPRLELQQGRDEDEELGRRLEVELAAALEEVEVAEHHVGQLDLEQVDLLAQDERQQQVERPGEDLQVELEVSDGNGATRDNGSEGPVGDPPARRRRPPPSSR